MGVGREGRRADRDRVEAGTAEGADEDVDGVVGAAGDDDIVRRDAVERGHRRLEPGRLRLGIAVEAGGERAVLERRGGGFGGGGGGWGGGGGGGWLAGGGGEGGGGG